VIYKDFSEIPDKFFINVPVLIPTFNQLSLCKNTIERLSDFGLHNFVVLDNGSSYPPFLEWMEKTDVPVVIYSNNPGPRMFFTNANVWNRMPQHFIVTDPDLEYPQSIPLSLIADMIEITEKNQWSKVALGLNTEPADKMHDGVKHWEAAYWNAIIEYMPSGDPIYNAKTDTTFALYNKKYVSRPGDLSWGGDFFTSPRMCGNYMCQHLGWYIDKKIPQEEVDFYEQHATAWSSTNEAIKKKK
jgi:glycosyltransferase involved in cell wall biosynthesis